LLKELLVFSFQEHTSQRRVNNAVACHLFLEVAALLPASFVDWPTNLKEEVLKVLVDFIAQLGRQLVVKLQDDQRVFKSDLPDSYTM
jgi:hypothetical protein